MDEDLSSGERRAVSAAVRIAALAGWVSAGALVVAPHVMGANPATRAVATIVGCAWLLSLTARAVQGGR